MKTILLVQIDRESDLQQIPEFNQDLGGGFSLMSYVIPIETMFLSGNLPQMKANGDLVSNKKLRSAFSTNIMRMIFNRMEAGEFIILPITAELLADKAVTPFIQELRKLPQKNHYQMKWLKISDNDFLMKEMQRQFGNGLFNYQVKNVQELLEFEIVDLNSYDEVRIIGDLQGCYDVLKLAINDSFQNVNTTMTDEMDFLLNPQCKYIFIGDLFDRGIQNKEVFDFFMKIHKAENVVIIEGNHELHLSRFVQGKTIHNTGFITDTLTEIFDVKGKVQFLLNKQNQTDDNQIQKNDALLSCLMSAVPNNELNAVKKGFRQLYQKCVPVYAFSFNGKKYLCTHGGIAFVPPLITVSNKNLISGAGNHSEGDLLTQTYKENFLVGKCQDFIQIFGHRAAKSNEVCFNLIDGELREFEGKMIHGVEYGGKLPVLVINKNGLNMQFYKNPIDNMPNSEKMKFFDDVE